MLLQRSRLALAVGLVLVAAMPGCSRSTSSGPARGTAAGPAELHIAAASDLHEVLAEIIESYAKVEPTVRVVPTFGPSGQLARQVAAGAPFGLILSANERFVRELAAQNHVEPESVHPYAIGALVVVYRPDTKVASLADLAAPAIRRLVIANPETAPYGTAARQALQHAGVWDRLGDRLVMAETVLQAYTHVRNGDAEAGLVGKALTRNTDLGALDVDPALYDPIVQALGVVSGSPEILQARGFAGYLLGPEARAIFVRHGFRLPAGP